MIQNEKNGLDGDANIQVDTVAPTREAADHCIGSLNMVVVDDWQLFAHKHTYCDAI